MSAILPARRHAAFRLLGLLGLGVLAAACTDSASPTATEPDPPPSPAIQVVSCTASVTLGSVECGVDDDAALGDRVVGGQGVYVRLLSSNVAYAAGTFSFDVAVQNLSNLPFATSDGATRHANGIRIFFHDDPAVTGTGSVVVSNPTGTGTFTGSAQPYFQYGGTVGGMDGEELGADGILTSGETSSARQWQLSVPATVSSFTFQVYVSTATPSGEIATVAPQVSEVNPATLVPGQIALVYASNHAPAPEDNVVTVGGVQAQVLAVYEHGIGIRVPCVPSGTVGVQVASLGLAGAPFAANLAVAHHRTLLPGEFTVVSAENELECNQVAAWAEGGRYLVAVVNAFASNAVHIPFQVSVHGPAGAPHALADGATAAHARAASRQPHPIAAAGPDPSAGGRHHRLLDENRATFERLRARFGAGSPAAARDGVLADAVPPETRTIRVPRVGQANPCMNHDVVDATRVYYSGKVALYEDDAIAPELRASANPAMQAYYTAIGDHFNSDMEPIIRNHFGDLLRRDPLTDADGAVSILFTPRVNQAGFAGFVVPCDLYPNDEGSAEPVNASSNFGEFLYVYTPGVAGTGYESFTPDAWYNWVRSVVIHEAKHLASLAARAANGAPFEASWLEEGTALHAEELWARQSVYGVAWKGNTGYGSAGSPGSIYCDFLPTDPACLATSPHRPAYIMGSHFLGLGRFMQASSTYTPFGGSGAISSLFYQGSWSLVRWAVDRHAVSEAAFLTALTQASETGTANLQARTGMATDQMLARWALSLVADDHPGIASPHADLQMPTWHLPEIFAGLKAEQPLVFTTAYPAMPATLSGGNTVSHAGMVGGGVQYVEFAAAPGQPLGLWLRSPTGDAPFETLRLAILRVE
jgi:hypothetical protein